MAGTRFLLQLVILAELLCVALLSIHVGFCHPRLGPPYKGNVYPHVTVKEDYGQTDPVLCPWKYIAKTCGYGNNQDRKLASVTDSNSFPFPTIKLRYLLVLEEVSELLSWSAILEKEFNIPSYLEQLESVQIEKAIQVHVVPRMNELLTWNDTNSFMPELWNHLAKNIVSGLVEKDTSVLILYIPQMLETQHNWKGVDGLSITTDSTPPPPVRSFQLDLSSSSKTLETNIWVLLPTTKEVDGHLGSYMDTWTVQTILDSSSSDDSDVATAFWNLLQANWKQQALQLHQYISTLPAARDALDTLVLPTKDSSRIDLSGVQSSVLNWQNFFSTLQALLLFHRGSTKIPPKLPPPLIQDFPLEHYAAIFMPLLFPLLVPFVISTVKEYNRWKEKRKSIGENKGSSNNDESMKQKAA
jgi:hypothetical protein